jgi:hypothetical protein
MIRTKPYRIARIELSRISALYYLKTLWFILIGPFLFGLVLLLFGPNQTFRVFGLILAMWPGTIFVRSLIVTRRNAEVWSKPTVAWIEDGTVYFESEEEPVRRFKIAFQNIRNVVRIAGYLLLQTRKFGFVPIPISALGDPDQVELITKQIRSR